MGDRALGRLYEQGHGRIIELVSAAGDASSIPVPACPKWSLHDLVAHLAGNCTDLLNGNVAGAAMDWWTAAQVDERRDRETSSVIAEWIDAAPQVAGMIDDFPGRYGYMLVGDVTVHEHDVRGALSRPGARVSAAVETATDFVVGVFTQPAARVFGLGPLRLISGEREWVLGTGEPATGDLEAWRAALSVTNGADDAAEEIVGTLRSEPFELFRALTGRRSAAQIRAFDWSVDPDAWLPIFGFGPFTVRPHDLDE